MNERESRPAGFDFSAFYRAVDRTRAARANSWRQVADEAGVGKSTLARMARDCRPDADGLAALAAWARLNPADYVTLPPRGRSAAR
jgi:hypothetical protein